MGSIVKSIGKVFKKIGKGIKKIVKKIGPALLIAAAVYVGVAFYGASLGVTAAGTATLSPTNFMAGLGKMTAGVKNFFMPATGGVTQAAGAATQAAGAAVPSAAASQLGAAGNVGVQAGFNAMTGPGTTMGSAGASTAMANAGTVIPRLASSVAGGMSTGDALVYMQKMNMVSMGLKFGAGLFDDSEKKQMEHEKGLLSMKYAFGKPMGEEQEAFKAANPNWIAEHPAMQGQDLYSSPNLMQSQAMANLPTQGTAPSPYVQQQSIGQPNIGRQMKGQYGTTPQRTFTGNKQGLITRGAQPTFDSSQQRRVV